MFVLFTSFAVALIDQISKYVIGLRFHPGESIAVVPGLFNLAYVRNTGAAWGMLGGMNRWLALFSIVILIVVLVFRRSFLKDILIHRLALGLMTGGIVGNLIDRVRLQYVVDFLDFHVAAHHFPAFNVADAAICIGAGLYILSTFSAPAGKSADCAGPGSGPAF